MTCLICGSMAYDTIMFVDGRFSDESASNPLRKMNASFLVPNLRRRVWVVVQETLPTISSCSEWTHKSWRPSAPMVGPYLERLAELEISTRHIRTIKGAFTAQGVHHDRCRR